MKFSSVSKLSREDFLDAPEWFGRFLDTYNTFLDETLLALRGQLSLIENALVQVVNIDFTHGVAANVQNKLKSKPKGIIPLYAQNNMIVGYSYEYTQKNELQITLNFSAGVGTTANCFVLVIG